MQRTLRHLFIKSLAIIFILTSSFLVSGIALADTAVDVQNIGFEDWSTDSPLYWDVNSWENNGRAFSDSSIKHSGQKSVCIQNDKPTDTRCRQGVSVKPNTVYKISCWVKTQDVGADKKGANISVAEITDTSKDIHGTNSDWENISLYGRTGNDQNKITLTVGLGGYGSLNSGKAWFDDVSVTEVSSVPGGENIVSLFMNSQSDNASSTSTNNGNTSTNMILILLIAAVVIIVGVGIVLMRGNNKSKQAMSGEDSDTVIVKKSETDLKPYKIGRPDIIIMAVMTSVYLVVALINLGGTDVPQTPWKPTKVNESFIVDLGKKQDVKRISYYDALGDGWYASGNYIVQYLDETGNYKLIGNLEKKDVFTWKYIDVNISTERLKFIVEKPGGTLNEIGIFGSDRNTPLKVNIIDKNQEKEDDGRIENLFDEQKFARFSPSYMTSTYFDEIYHARTAYEFIHHITPYENTHPPLGKVFISLGIMVFGMNPLGWRIVGTLFGAAMLPIMYMFGFKIFKKRFYAFFTAALMMFDFMHFAQTRIATVDVYGTFFVILMYYFMYDYFTKKSYNVGFKKSLIPLFLCGITFGLGSASKWIGLYAGGGLAVLFFLSRWYEFDDYKAVLNKRKKNSWVNDFIPVYIVRTCIYCIPFFIIIPGIIYFLSYIPWFMVPNSGNPISLVWENQKSMLNYHSTLVATHPYSSNCWSWLVDYKPVLFYTGFDLPAGKSSIMLTMGNPIILWVGLLCILAAVVLSIQKKDRKMIVIFTAMFFQFAPWIFISRLEFIYHYFSTIPFLIICIVYVGKCLADRIKEFKYVNYGFIAVAGIFFCVYYPILSGWISDTSYVQGLKILSSWAF